MKQGRRERAALLRVLTCAGRTAGDEVKVRCDSSPVRRGGHTPTWRGRVVTSAVSAVMVLALARSAGAGHESPFYPSYYPQEIRIESVAPTAAGGRLQAASIHAFIGGDPFSGRGSVPGNVASVESLGGYVVVTMDTASPRLGDPATRCAAARGIVRSLVRAGGAYVVHPYPVTPYDRDYLEHADLAAAARQYYLGGSGGSGGAGRPGKDARVETVDAGELLAGAAVNMNGWLGPPWLKEGWFHAYLLLAGSVADRRVKAEADQVYHRLVEGSYDGLEEKVNLERALVSLLTQGCERVIVGYTLRREYFNTDYSPGIENIGFDSHSGLNSAVFLRTAKLKDFPWNGVLRIGVAAAPVAAWSPVGGFGDGFGRLLWSAVGDTAFLPGPYNGSWTANRVTSQTWTEHLQQLAGGLLGTEALAHQALDIPPEALIPRPGSGALERVGPGTRAREMVEYRVLASAFHDGTRMTVADVLYPYVFAYRWSGDARDPRAYDRYVDRATALMRRVLVGIKVVGTQKVVKDLGGDLQLRYDVPIVRIYLNYPAVDPQRAAAIALPWSTLPWHVLVLMEEAVRRGMAAFSSDAAAQQHVEVLDLVRSPGQNARLAQLVDEFAAQGYVPEALHAWSTRGEARRRWRQMKAFYQEHGHFLVTNGPYRLKAWSHDAAVVEAFRDLSYPLGVGSFDKYARPRRAYLSKVSLQGDTLEVRPDVERVIKYDRYYKIVREPLGSNTSGAIDEVSPVCRYVVVRHDGRVVNVGTAPAARGGIYAVDLHERLDPGAYTVMVTVYLNENDMTPDVKILPYRRH